MECIKDGLCHIQDLLIPLSAAAPWQPTSSLTELPTKGDNRYPSKQLNTYNTMKGDGIVRACERMDEQLC